MPKCVKSRLTTELCRAVKLNKNMSKSKNQACPFNLHILGPDDIIPHAEEITALREANALNLMMAKEHRRHANDPNFPWSMAVVEARAGDRQPVTPEPKEHKALASATGSAGVVDVMLKDAAYEGMLLAKISAQAAEIETLKKCLNGVFDEEEKQARRVEPSNEKS